MEKYVIVSIIEINFPEQFRSVDWPLHVTLLRPFVTSISVGELCDTLTAICAAQSVIVTEGVTREFFGVDGTVPVTELANTSELQSIHDAFKSVFKGLIEFTSSEYPTFRPHVTDNKGMGVQVGEQVRMVSISLVKMTSQLYQVIHTCQLSDGSVHR